MLPEKIDNKCVCDISKSQLENIIKPVLEAKLHKELYKILKVKASFESPLHYQENDINPSHRYFGTHEFTFKIGIKGHDKIINQKVIVKPKPLNLSEITLPSIYNQYLFLHNYLNTSKAEIEQYLFAIVKNEMEKIFQQKYNSQTLTLKSVFAEESKVYSLKSNANETDNYQQAKTIIITVESLQPEIMVGKIDVSINVKGITKSLADVKYLFRVEDKIINDKAEIEAVVSTQFKS